MEASCAATPFGVMGETGGRAKAGEEGSGEGGCESGISLCFGGTWRA